MLFAAAVPALAQESISYVALGDSSTNGYGLAGFVFSQSGRFSVVKDAYIWRFADYLRESGKEVSFTNLALCGMCTNDLVYFLDPTIPYDELGAYSKQWYTDFTGETATGERKDKEAYTSRAELTETYQNAIRNADIITYDLGTNNFGNYMVARLAGIFGVDIGFAWEGYDQEHFNDLMAKNDIPISLELKNTITKLVETVTGGAVTEDILAQLTDTLLFSYANFVLGFRDSIDQIYQLKKDDAELIVLGLANTLSGTVAKIAGITIDLGALYGSVIDLANEYIISLNPHCNDYQYADLKGGVENVVEALGAGKVYPDLADDLFDLFYSGNMLGAAAPAFVGKLAYGEDGHSVTKKQAKAAYRSEEASPEKTAAESIINTFMKAAAYSDPLDVEAGLPYVQNGLSGMGEVFIEAFTDYDNASELAKGATKLILNLLENGTGAHPSVYGHEQKLNAVIKAYKVDIPANTTHIKRFLSGTLDFMQSLFSSPDWLGTVRAYIRDFFSSLLPIKFC